MIDINITNKFIKHFKGRNIFVSMKDDNSAAPSHFHREFSACCSALVKRNEDLDCGIFFTVNELDKNLDPGRQRTGRMWERGRALFLDDDEKRSEPRSDFVLIPNLIVSTSSGKYHYYWLIEDGIEDKEEYLSVQRSLVQEYHGDGNVKDVTRYLRLPGFMHRKKVEKEVNDRIVEFIDNVEDGVKPYKWETLSEAFGRITNSNSDNDVGGNSNRAGRGGDDADGKSVDESTNEIINGVNYHENLVSLSYQMIREGVKPVYVVMALQGIMNQVKEELRDADDRWINRYTDIERIVKGGESRDDEEHVEIPTKEEFDRWNASNLDVDLPWPPGLMGELCNDAYNMARYQYKEVALVSAIGLVAGVAGRKFNISDTGLNVYLTLIMGTGMGKDSISKFISRTLISLNDNGIGSSFIGAKRFTGPKAVINHLKDARSRVCVFTEAGILMRSQAGDQDGLTRLLLGLYTCSGKHDYSGGEEFSSTENRIESLRSPALTIINEATPETLLVAFRDAGSLENGHLPRQSVFRVQGNKPYANRKIQKELSAGVRDRMLNLVKKCSSFQSVENCDAWEFEYSEDIEDEVHDYQKECVDLENFHRGEDNVKSIMISRMFMKAIKFAAIASVLNKDESSRGSLIIERPEWEWGKSLAEYEFNSIDCLFSGHGNNIIEDLSLNIVREGIIKLLNGEYGKNKKVGLSKLSIRKQEVPYSNLYQLFRNNMKFVEVGKYVENPAEGLVKVLEHMVSVGYLHIINKNTGENPAIMVGKGSVKRGERVSRKYIYKPTRLLISMGTTD